MSDINETRSAVYGDDVSKEIITAAQNRLQETVNNTNGSNSKVGKTLVQAIKTTLKALKPHFTKETAQAFADSMDSFGVNLKQACDIVNQGLWGIGPYSSSRMAPIPSNVFNEWAYQGNDVSKILEGLHSFYTDNSSLSQALRTDGSSTPLTFNLQLPNEEPLKSFFAGKLETKNDCGLYEAAIAFLCCSFDTESGKEENSSYDGDMCTSYGVNLTTSGLDIEWNGGACEVKHNNKRGSGFDLKRDDDKKCQTVEEVRTRCSYFDKGCVAIVDTSNNPPSVHIFYTKDQLANGIMINPKLGLTRTGAFILKQPTDMSVGSNDTDSTEENESEPIQQGMNESTKFTLTIGQLKKLIAEANVK